MKFIRPMTHIVKLLPASSLLVALACSDTSFEGGSGTVRKTPPPPTKGGKGDLDLSLRISTGSKNIDLTATFTPASKLSGNSKSTGTGKYNLIPGTVTIINTDGLSAELVEALKSAKMAAEVQQASQNYTVAVTMDIPATKVEGEPVAAQKLSLSEKSVELKWSKDEGATDKFGKLDRQTSVTGCKIEPNGNAPKSGVYSVVLTKPADCNFTLTSLKVGRANTLQDVPIGSYWKWSASHQKAHAFALNSNFTTPIDNGFILVQPDGKSYLLADAGSARSGGKDTATIANDLSRTLGFGDTQLLQPNPGNSADNFKGATVFMKGSVIAIYDDTPDMGGVLDVNSLVSSAQNGGVRLSWSAQVR